MTLVKRESEKRVWKCDICGEVNYWGDSWRTYCSIADLDALPQEDIPTLCSDECQKMFETRLKSGDIRMPKVSNRGYTFSVKGEKRGY